MRETGRIAQTRQCPPGRRTTEHVEKCATEYKEKYGSVAAAIDSGKPDPMFREIMVRRSALEMADRRGAGRGRGKGSGKGGEKGGAGRAAPGRGGPPSGAQTGGSKRTPPGPPPGPTPAEREAARKELEQREAALREAREDFGRAMRDAQKIVDMEGRRRRELFKKKNAAEGEVERAEAFAAWKGAMTAESEAIRKEGELQAAYETAAEELRRHRLSMGVPISRRAAREGNSSESDSNMSESESVSYMAGGKRAGSPDGGRSGKKRR